jgi:glucosamine-6-phosphate deaminase
MKLIVAKDYEHMSKIGAMMIASQTLLNPNIVLGLATGSTPVGTYKELIRMYKDGVADFSKAITFNLDEYVGLKSEDPNSYHYFMRKNFFEQINILTENTHIPSGIFEDSNTICNEYEKLINENGGIDLQLLGVGKNGHIGFNEPDIKFEDITHVVSLDEQTIKDNARFFGSIDMVPKKAVSMGIKTIMKARAIILEVTGKEKAQVLYEAIKGPITPKVPVSALRLHSSAVIIADLASAYKLELKEGVYDV